MKTIVVIPNYNHGEFIERTLQKLAAFNLPCLIVDDGSDDKTKAAIQAALTAAPFASLLTLPTNQGKGAAVIAGFKEAYCQGFTHAIQVDADGQHCLDDIPTFISAAKEHPDALIAGAPLYDDSIPKSRLYGRKITNFWVRIETLGLPIKDAMCGFRLYPLERTLTLVEKKSIGRRMNFDIDILVRLLWQKPDVIWIPTKVIYPETGSSHFRMLKDNIEISWLHTKLFFGMIYRLPKLLWQRAHKNKSTTHWSELKEKGSFWCLKFTLWFYKLLGRHATNILLYGIIAYFYLTHRQTRRYSYEYLEKVKLQLKEQKNLTVFNHMLSFGKTALDKLAVWNGDITTEQLDFPKQELLKNLLREKQGGVILTAHLGNIEIARAIAQLMFDVKINAVVFQKHAKMFNSLIEKLNPAFRFNLIETTAFDIPLAMQLKEKVDAGEFIVIVADRTSTTQPERTIKTKFLGKTAPLPQGPFVLAGLMQCPVYFMLCLKKENDRFEILLEDFAEKIDLSRNQRETALSQAAQRYAQLLEQQCLRYPLQWFNFFDFWR